MALMTVYHGGYQAIEKPEIRNNKYTKDFGTGFYCTVIKEQAQRWAKRYDTKIVTRNPKNKVDIALKNLGFQKVNVLVL